MYDQNKQSSVIRTMKAMITSSLFLVSAIGYSVYALFELLGGFGGGSAIESLMNLIPELDWGYGMDYSYIQTYLGVFQGIRVLAVLISAIPAALIVAGMWITFASAKNNSQPDIKVTGLTMIRVLVIVRLVCMCLGAALLELVCIAVMAGLNASLGAYGSSGSLGGAVVILMLGIAAGSAVKIIYYVQLGKLINKMKASVMNGKPDNEVSLYVEIVCYIFGGTSALSALTSLVGISIYGFFGNAGLATANIGFGIFLRKYRNNMGMIMQGTDPFVYQKQVPGQPSYQQVYQLSGQQHQESVQPSSAQLSYQHQALPQSSQQQPSGQRDDRIQVKLNYNHENETTVLPYYNGTSVLSGQIMAGHQIQLVRMTRLRTGETICISKPSFWIGKDSANVDYYVTDNTAVSRRHALVTIQNGRCYIRDNHSTNRLFINGQAIEPDTDVLLTDGDRIHMGDEEFVLSIG